MSLLDSAGLGRTGTLYLFSGAHALVACVSMVLVGCIAIGLAFSFWVFLSRILLRCTWAAVIAVILWGTAANALSSEPSLFSLIPIVLAVGIIMFVLFRFGLLAFIASALFYSLLLAFPITAQFSAWYSKIGLTGLALLLAMALYAFHTSLGGQPLFGRAALED
jgi:hypothetical protein